ncbi:hypothetical protein GLI01_18670 [Gluconacetobacter liquefaciens]|nr:hypothetical protein [Gluconacetobacter liquefaciens]MBB2187110.1 hypothetical protein [Gluconacetobacter liquefaciens]GBQ97984.1 hypothetical protein AA0522_1022 [Gluconacetobacter liquefaciens NRIC 0522]GEB37832.1 hypothetical protein GLI01_18670 [Gluconacetobacter liquefaciens]
MMNPLDQFVPRFDFSERHHIDIAAPARRIMNAVAAYRTQDDRLTRMAIRLREVPARLLGQTQGRPLDRSDFTLLERRDDTAIVYGLIGAFWQADYGLCAIPAPAIFQADRQDDVCKLVLGFTLHPGPGHRRRLVTETRVFCVTARARRLFTPYWYLIRPVSGLIRRRMLAAICRASEDRAGIGLSSL